METDKDFGVGKSKLHLPQRSLNFMHSPSFPPSFSQKMRSFQLPSKSCWGVYSPRALFSLWKYFPLSSTLLSPAQTCFRCPSDSPSAAVLWEALVQCSHSLHSAGWSLHPHTRQAVHWSLLFSGAVTLKTVSKEKRDFSEPCVGDHVSFPACSLATADLQVCLPRSQQGPAQTLCWEAFRVWWGVVRKHQILCTASQQLASTLVWKQGATTAPQLTSGESPEAWQVSNCQKATPNLVGIHI